MAVAAIRSNKTGAVTSSGTKEAARYAIPRLPGPARLIVLPTGTQVAVETRCRYDARLARISILGPTSRAATLWVEGPAPIEVELDAAVWSRMTRVRADTVTDRVVPAATLGMMSGDVEPGDATASARLAHGLVAHASRQHDPAGAAIIAAFSALVARLDVGDVAAAAATLGITPHLLRRTTLKHFGFAPKLLMVRARFLAALEAFRVSGMRFDSVLGFGYFDSSHFLRDANRFLGTTPRRYLDRVAAMAPGAWDYAAAA